MFPAVCVVNVDADDGFWQRPLISIPATAGILRVYRDDRLQMTALIGSFLTPPGHSLLLFPPLLSCTTIVYHLRLNSLVNVILSLYSRGVSLLSMFMVEMSSSMVLYAISPQSDPPGAWRQQGYLAFETSLWPRSPLQP